jgi:hypothetical protein
MMSTMSKLKILLTAALVGTSPALAQTHDASLAALNRCYVGAIKVGRIWADPYLWTCMEEQGFYFCDDCEIPHSGDKCRDDEAGDGPNRAACWRIIENNDEVS